MKESSSRNEKLRQQRLRRHWTLQYVADALETTVTTVQRWERGSQYPRLYYHDKLCALFDLSPQELGLEMADLLPVSGLSEAQQANDEASEEIVIWTVPYRRNAYFTGRDELLKEIEQRFAVPEAGQAAAIHQVALTQAQAMTGLGGIGKTQIAVEYAYRALVQGRYVHTLWITAASEETMLASLTSVAALLPTLNARKETDQYRMALAVITWLEQCQQPWLLIFDNADDLSLITHYLPRRGRGNILLTTRTSAVSTLALSIEVEPLEVIEGTQLLLRRARHLSALSDEEINEARNLVIALGQLPLALDQAGAYIEETGCGIDEYLQLYQQHRLALLKRRGQQSVGYPESVATTWLLSFEHIKQANPAAAQLLQLCAYLAPDDIPEELLTRGAPYWPAQLRQAVADRITFNQVLEILLQFSLVKRVTRDRQLSIHRLVQVVQMESMEVEEQIWWAERVVCAVNEVFPTEPREAGWLQCQRYLEQAQMCALFIHKYAFQFPEAAKLQERVGMYLHERTLYSLAEPFLQEALHFWEQQKEQDNAHLVSILSNLGELYKAQGRYAEAETHYRRAHAIYKQGGAQEDCQFVTLLLRLAILSRLQGKYTEAESLLLRVLQLREYHLGPEHVHLGYPLNSLANLYFDQEKYREAELLYQRVLRIWEQQLGPEHPHVASVLCNLANLSFKQEQHAQAQELHLQALQI